MGLLIGTDYFPGIRGLGPKKSLTLIKKYNRIENVLVHTRSKYDFKGLTPDIIKKVRKILLFPDINTSVDNFHWNYPQRSSVLKLLCEEHFLNRERVENNLTKLANNFKKCKNYFQKMKPKSIQLTL